MIIVHFLLLSIIAWLAFKLFIRFYVIYKHSKNFINMSKKFHAKNFKGFHTNANFKNRNAYQRSNSYDANNSNGNSNNNYTNNQKKTSKQAENNNTKMVECRACQLFVPIDESYNSEGKYYCCKEHTEN